MVRGRRTRRAAATSATTIASAVKSSPSPIIQQATVTTTTLHTTLAPISPNSSPARNGITLVDEYCASPKRKEYKIDEVLLGKQNGENNGVCGMFLKNNGFNGATVKGGVNKSTNVVLTENKLKPMGPRRGSNTSVSSTTNGNEITRFLFNQSKSKSRKNRKKSPNIELVNDDTCDSFTQATTLTNGDAMDSNHSEDHSSMDQKVFPSFKMFTNRPTKIQMNDLNGDCESNIFLQEPVLKLNVDQSVLQAATAMTAPILAAGKKATAEGKFGSLTKGSNVNTNVAVCLLNQDSNSGDSGVVVDKLQEMLSPQGLMITRQRKPTTPHRIFCPSSPQSSAMNGGGAEVKRGDEEEGDCLMKEEDCDEGSDGGHSNAKRKLDLPEKGEVVPSEKDVDCLEKTSNVTTKTSTMPTTCNGTTAATKNGMVVGKVTVTQSTMVDFFKVRRSVRKTKKEVEREEQLALERAIIESCEDGLAVKMFENKGRGIMATRPFSRGEFVVEYIGEFISIAEANKREQVYAEDQGTGCYMYYFKHKNKQYCIDATEETGKLGRLVNHSRNGNLVTKTVDVKGRPHLVLIAKEDIELGKELTYDYGDRSKESLVHHPWLAF